MTLSMTSTESRRSRPTGTSACARPAPGRALRARADGLPDDTIKIAGKRLGADVVNMHAAQSSVKKGETLIDTAVTLKKLRTGTYTDV